MSLARRHLARVAAGIRFDFAGVSAAALAAGIAQCDGDQAHEPAQAGDPLDAQALAQAEAAAPGGDSLAKRHRQRLAAAVAANDNDDGAPPAEVDRMLEQLREHQRQLKAIQSIEKKIALKREILPTYAAWVQGWMTQSPVTHDEVALTVMLWLIDVGEYEQALYMADAAIKARLSLPERFKRTIATWVAEEIADAALKANIAGATLPAGTLDLVQEVVAGHDMPDEVKARLFKAQGLELMKLAEEPIQGQASAAWRPSHLKEALSCLKQALALDERVGVKKDIERLERELKKSDPPA